MYHSLLILAAITATSGDPDVSKFPRWEHVEQNTEITDIAHDKSPLPLARSEHAKSFYSHGYFEDNSGRWKTPEQFDNDHLGNCIDFAIHDYYAVANDGGREKETEVVVGKLIATGEIHAAYHVGNFYFDNMSPDGVTTEKYMEKFKPYYSINRFGWKALSPVNH